MPLIETIIKIHDDGETYVVRRHPEFSQDTILIEYEEDGKPGVRICIPIDCVPALIGALNVMAVAPETPVLDTQRNPL